MTYSETRFAPAGHTGNTVGRWFVGILVAISMLAVGYLTIAAYTPTFTAASFVKVDVPNGHGSGIHIGGGRILTATHVVVGQTTVPIKLSDGSTRNAQVLWADKESDIALLQTDGEGIAASTINCAPNVVGANVHAIGNPLFLEFVRVAGRISTPSLPIGHWAAGVIVDMVSLPGMSGSGVLNDREELVGIVVGTLTAPVDFGGSFTGLGMLVPAEHICGLLDRR